METISPYKKTQRHKDRISLGVKENWKKRHNWINTHKLDLTTRQLAQIKRIYGS